MGWEVDGMVVGMGVIEGRRDGHGEMGMGM